MKGSRTRQIAGWLLTVVVAAFLIGVSAVGKFLEWEGKEEMFAHLGYSTALIEKIGVLEIILTLVFLFPRTSFLGAILLTGYLGGATATHVRVGDPFFFPVFIGVLIWGALALRRPEILSLTCCGSRCCLAPDDTAA